MHTGPSVALDDADADDDDSCTSSGLGVGSLCFFARNDCRKGNLDADTRTYATRKLDPALIVDNAR